MGSSDFIVRGETNDILEQIIKKQEGQLFKSYKIVLVSLTRLVGTLYNLCRGWSSNPGHPTSPHLIV